MTADTVNGSGNGARSGAHTLVLLAAPLNVAILRAIAEGERRQLHLRHATGMPAQTTLRAQLKRLGQVGAIEKQRRDRFPGALEYDLTAAGRDLLRVAAALERWLRLGPDRPLSLGGTAAKAAIKAFAEGWSATILRALAASPMSLTELDSAIASFSYPSLERRLAALRLAGQVKAQTGNGRGTPHAVTAWARAGVGPLMAAARWERRHTPRDAQPVARVDAEAVFLLAAPLLRLPAELSGSCRLAVELPGAEGPRLAGAVIEFEDGRLRACTARLDGTPAAWALGSVSGWLDAIVSGDADRIELGGDNQLARAVVDSLHRALLGAGSVA